MEDKGRSSKSAPLIFIRITRPKKNKNTSPGVRMRELIKQENLITYDDFLGTSRRCHYNEFIAEFYERFADDDKIALRLAADGTIVYGKDETFIRRAARINECCTRWTFDHYVEAGYKNLVRMTRCDDRFCLNCQTLVADQRQAQYSPILDEFALEYDLYHVVLTVPNVDAEHLADTISLMFDRFGYMIRFFSGRKKVRGVDFTKYGYIAAVRALEVTVSKKDGSFHPHLHCIFVLKKNLDLPKVYWNAFSVDRTGRQGVRLFSELDMLFQRLWCLLIMKIEVTKWNIENMAQACPAYPNGFSCVADQTNGDYHEVFKYAIKGSFKNETLFDYEAFRTLYNALFKRKAYQTYGVLESYDFNEYDESLGLNELDEVFELFLLKLQKNELPQRIEEALTKILSEWNEVTCKYVSKATFLRHFKALTKEEKEETLKGIVGEEVFESKKD